MDILGLESIEETVEAGKKFTVVYWEGGKSKKVPHRAITVVKDLALRFGKTPKAMKCEWQTIMKGESNRMAPLYISRAITLLPVKTKTGTAYVNLAYETEIEGNKIKFLRSKREIKSILSTRALLRKVSSVRVYRMRCAQRLMWEEESLKDIKSYWYLKGI